MPRPLATTLAVLGLTLVFFNLYCFAHCLVQSCDVSAMPCHSQGHSKSDQCSDRHDVKVAAINDLEGCVAIVPTGWIETSEPSPNHTTDSPDSHAALPSGSTAFRPLRV